MTAPEPGWSPSTLPGACRICPVRRPTFCSRLGGRGLDLLRSITTPLWLRPGQLLIRESDPPDHVFNITAGVVRTLKALPGGRQRVTGFQVAGEFLGLTGARPVHLVGRGRHRGRGLPLPAQGVRDLPRELPRGRAPSARRRARAARRLPGSAARARPPGGRPRRLVPARPGAPDREGNGCRPLALATPASKPGLDAHGLPRSDLIRRLSRRPGRSTRPRACAPAGASSAASSPASSPCAAP